MVYRHKIALTSFLLVISTNLIAGDWHETDSFYLWSNTYQAEIIRVEVPSGIINPSACSDPDSYMVLSSIAESAQQRIYSTLLAAKMAGKKIQLRIDGCESNKPALINVRLVE